MLTLPFITVWLFAGVVVVLARPGEPDEAYCAKLRVRSRDWLPDGDTEEEVRDADEVEAGLWLGNVCAATDTAFLQKHNITATVNMAREWDALCTVGDAQRAWDFLKGRAPWRHCFPLDDVTSGQDVSMVQQRLGAASHWISHYRAKGQSVLVHCNMGVSRSAAAVVYHMLARDARLTYERALGRVRQARAIARPNALFEQLLDSVEERKRRWKLRHSL